MNKIGHNSKIVAMYLFQSIMNKICLALYFVVEHDDVTKIVIKIWIYKHINIFSKISFNVLYANRKCKNVKWLFTNLLKPIIF